MDIRALTTDYAVSPQITPEDVPDIVAAGFGTVICNRPDIEIVPDLQADRIREVAEAAGLTFVVIPIPPGEMSPSSIREQRSVIEASEGPTLAYCASGTRSTIVWMFGAAATTSLDELVETATRAGYPLGNLRPQLELAANLF